MISRISGKVVEKGANYLMLDLGGICYEVLIPSAEVRPGPGSSM